MDNGLSLILLGAAGGAAARAPAGATSSRGPFPTASTSPSRSLAIPFWWAIGLPLWPDVAIQVGVAALVFGLFAIAFAMGAMGGGDVKLIGALALWLPSRR